jgi:hypothetical protein
LVAAFRFRKALGRKEEKKMSNSNKPFSFYLHDGRKMGRLVILLITCLCAGRIYSNELPFIPECFTESSNKATLQEMVIALEFLRTSLEREGYNPPSLSELSLHCRSFIEDYGIEFSEEQFQQVFSKIFDREQVPYHLQSFKGLPVIELVKRKGHIDDSELTDGFAIGFCKFLAGALCCIIPDTTVRSFGVMLMGDGIKDMIQNEEKPKFMGKPIGAQRISCA